ncbi:hypothetical protein LJC61_03215 [Ruminococcaceae bacterium OttesenSCG-928-A16]|nr:hypothetical protein [Ruminococcaceae bacterium OttesenSCG-928-A16]
MQSKHGKHGKKRRQMFFMLLGVALFLMVLWAALWGAKKLPGAASQEGAANTQRAIQHAAVLCYASEGFYPPGLTYIEEKYGVQIDYDYYVVRYEIFGSNVMPQIKVVLK